MHEVTTTRLKFGKFGIVSVYVGRHSGDPRTQMSATPTPDDLEDAASVLIALAKRLRDA